MVRDDVRLDDFSTVLIWTPYDGHFLDCRVFQKHVFNLQRPDRIAR